MKNTIGLCISITLAFAGIMLCQSCSVAYYLLAYCGGNKMKAVKWTDTMNTCNGDTLLMSAIYYGGRHSLLFRNVPDTSVFSQHEFRVLDAKGCEYPTQISVSQYELQEGENAGTGSLVTTKKKLIVNIDGSLSRKDTLIIPPNGALQYHGENYFNDTIMIGPMPSLKKK
jgi:hypothetical protein